MSVDRLPDGGDDGRERGIETPPSTEPAPPEAPPPPEASQPSEVSQPIEVSSPKEDLPATEKPESTQRAVQANDSPEAADKAARPPHPPEARETAEPRSRQEHADRPPLDRDADEVDTRVEDQNRDTATESASDLPHSTDVTREGDHEVGMASENPMSDSLPSQEDSMGGVEEGAEELPEQEDPPNHDADSGPTDETSPAPNDDAPANGDRILPLTDKEWAEHVTEVRDTLDKARAVGLESHLLYTIDPDHQSWSKDRRNLHDSIINDIYDAAKDVPNQGHAIVAGGLGGAGKTTVLTGRAGIDLSNYLMINPDDLKEEMARRGMIREMDGLSPMEASDLVHEESSYLARQIALRAQSDGKNIIWDITMSTQRSTERRIGDLRDAGYSRVDGLFVDIPVEISIERTEARHREGHDKYRDEVGLGGRYVPPEVVERQSDPEFGSQNKRTFNSVRRNFNEWAVYDNSVKDRAALLRESGRNDGGSTWKESDHGQ
jgi:predicted ABC-type ATPase